MLRDLYVDKYSFVHLFGSLILSIVINEIFNLMFSQVFIITFFLGIVWETFDWTYHKIYYDKTVSLHENNIYFEIKNPILHKIFDISGFSKSDLIFDAIGSGVGTMLIIFFQ